MSQIYNLASTLASMREAEEFKLVAGAKVEVLVTAEGGGRYVKAIVADTGFIEAGDRTVPLLLDDAERAGRMKIVSWVDTATIVGFRPEWLP